MLDVSELELERFADLPVATGHLERRGTSLGNTPANARWLTSRGAVSFKAALASPANA
jgi:hypothetical protein